MHRIRRGRTTTFNCNLAPAWYGVCFLFLSMLPTKGIADAPPVETPIKVMTFNILQGGGEAKNVGFDNSKFDGTRIDEIAAVFKQVDADIVGVQEDLRSNALLFELGDGWNRVGSVYSRFALTKVSVAPYLTVVSAKLNSGKSITIVNCHWFPPRGGYGPDVIQNEIKKDPKINPSVLEQIAIKKCAVPDGARGYDATIKAFKTAIVKNECVILMGDFNEPSHLDWTSKYARHGIDPWVDNPTSVPLRCSIQWPGSVALEQLGLIDAYRAVHPDETKKPGFTWTPAYPEKTPGRRPYSDQVLERIDRIYFSGKPLRATKAAVVGEESEFSDIVFRQKWPSDHRAVLTVFEIDRMKK